MKQNTTFVITISRQLGSGGAYVGLQLAKKLDIFYADREIISKAAKRFSVLEKDLESRDEKILSSWQSFLQFSAFASDVYIPPKIMDPTDHDLFKAETEIIEHIAKERSAVIIGRCGSHILREYPNHISIFLHGDTAFRNSRVQKLYNVSEKTAGKMIAQSDKERASYCDTFTGKEWIDARYYDISIDTSKIGIDKSVELILNYFELRK
jgi:CMP/dCMP kinase